VLEVSSLSVKGQFFVCQRSEAEAVNVCIEAMFKETVRLAPNEHLQYHYLRVRLAVELASVSCI